MNSKLIFFCICFTLTVLVNAQLAITWQNCFGGSQEDRPGDLIQVEKENYMIIGYTTSSDGDVSFNHGGNDVWLLKLDINGALLNEKTFGGSDGDIGQRILKNDNNHYFLLNESWSSDFDITLDPYPQSGDYWIVKIDSSYNIIWDKIYGGTWFDGMYTGVVADNSDILVQGYTGSPDGDVSVYFGQYDIWQIKLNNSGELLSDFTIGSLGFDYGYAIINTSDNGYLVGGYTRVENGGGNIDCIPYSWYGEALLVKLDSNNNIEWQQCYGGSGNESMKELLEVDGGYIMIASANSNNGDLAGTGYHGDNDIWVIKTDFHGNILWSKCYGGTDFDSGYKIFPQSDGGYIVFGNTESNNGDVSGNHSISSHDADIWVFKIDANGNLKWQQCYGGIGDERIEYGVLKSGDSSFIVAGMSDYAPSYDVTCTSYSYGIYDYWIFKLSDSSVSINEINNHTSESIISIYPNPATELATFDYTLPESSTSGTIFITDISGRMMAKIPITSNQGQKIWDSRAVSPGIYYYTIIAERAVQSGKIIIL